MDSRLSTEYLQSERKARPETTSIKTGNVMRGVAYSLGSSYEQYVVSLVRDNPIHECFSEYWHFLTGKKSYERFPDEPLILMQEKFRTENDDSIIYNFGKSVLGKLEGNGI